MFWILAAGLLGCAWTGFAYRSAVVGQPLSWLIDVTQAETFWLISHLISIIGLGSDTPLAAQISAVGAMFAPFAVCLLLAEAVHTGAHSRAGASVLLIGGALLSFLALPGAAALGLLLLALAVSALLAAGRTVAVRCPIVVLLAAVTTYFLVDAFTVGRHLTDATGALLYASGQPFLWHASLAAGALVCAVGVTALLVRDS